MAIAHIWSPRARSAPCRRARRPRTRRRRTCSGKPLESFRYRDFGSLVSLGEYSTVGSLMGFLSGKNMFIEGYFARVMYRSLYTMHLMALHGPWKVALGTFARTLTRHTEPLIKLH